MTRFLKLFVYNVKLIIQNYVICKESLLTHMVTKSCLVLQIVLEIKCVIVCFFHIAILEIVSKARYPSA